MRRAVRTSLAAVAVVTAHALLAQTPMKPTVPGTPGDPVWQGILRLSDGRTFVTDGGLAIDVTIAKPAMLPARELPSKVMESYLKAAGADEYGLSDLRPTAPGKIYLAPNGIALNATYVDFLRRTLPAGARLRMSGGQQPIVVLAGGKIVGVLMPVKQ